MGMIRIVEIMCVVPIVIIAALVGVRMMLRPRSVRTLSVAFVFFALQFCVGPLIYVAPNGYPGLSSGAVIHSWAGVYLFWATCGLIALVWRGRAFVHTGDEPPQRSTDGVWPALDHAAQSVSPLVLFVLTGLCCFGLLVIHLRYNIVLSGAAGFGQMAEVPYAIGDLNSALQAIGLGFAVLAAFRIVRGLPGVPLMLGVLLVESVLMFVRGRRWFFAYVFSLFMVVLVRWGRLRPRHAIFLVLGGAVFWQVVFPFFWVVRKEWQTNADQSPVVWVQNAIGELTGDRNRVTDHQESLGSSVVDRLRTFSICYHVSEGLMDGNPTFGGRVLASAVAANIPRVVFPGKDTFIVYDDEAIARTYLGMTGVDLSTHLPLMALADLGLLGEVAFAVMFMVVLRVFERMFASALLVSGIAAAAIFGLFFGDVAMQMEHLAATPIGKLRDVAIIWLIAIVLRPFITGPQSTEDGQLPGAASHAWSEST